MSNRLLQLCLGILFSTHLCADPLFDAHLHYNSNDSLQFSPQKIIRILERNNIHHAVVTSTPASLSLTLHRYASQNSRIQIIPLLGAYRTHTDKISWVNDAELPNRIEAELKTGHWRGIGELHIFAKDRHSPVFHRIVDLATKYQLPLLIHGDPAVIDTLYEISPEQPVAWAHAGTYPYPDIIDDYLQRYPALMVDLSVRDDRIAPNGQILDEWYELFLKHSGRFIVGVDTFSTSRWYNLDVVIKKIHNWLDQLPTDVTAKLRTHNAKRLFYKQVSP